jgi:RNA 2',3'-cyclic 3'-phosphodiesterase
MLDVRLFTGLSLPPEVLAKLELLLEEIQPLARINWSPISQLHITTKFIGSFRFSRVPELHRYLLDVPRSKAFTVTLTGLRYFPGPHGSWVLYIRVEPSEGLTELAAALDNHLAFYDVRREREAYLPHVTIGRIPGKNPWLELDQRVESYLERPFGSFEVTEYHIYESTQSGYRIFASVPLA